MTRPVTAPRRLEKSDDRSEFASGATELDNWFRKFAWESQAAHNAATYVAVEGRTVIGYYALAMSANVRANAPAKIAKRRPAQVPCILLARLAMATHSQGEGWGADLLRDALVRSVGLSESIGAAAVLVHCRDEAAKASYLTNGDFLPSSVDPLHLFVPMKSLRAYVD